MQISQSERRSVLSWGGVCRGVGIGVVAVMLDACVGIAPIQENKVEATLPTQNSPIVVGQTDRAAVRKLLGEPWVKSAYWGFDLFRFSDRERELIVVFVPLWVSTVDVRLYVLVDYDATGKVAAYDKGVTHGPSVSRGPTSGGDAALLQAGETALAVNPVTHTSSIFVSPVRRDEYLAGQKPVDQCTVVLGCNADWQCTSSLTVDGGMERALPDSLYVFSKTPGELRIESVRPWLAPMVLPAGDRQLEVFTGKQAFANTRFQCVAGELSYALIDDPIRLSAEMPGTFREQPMLIWRDGQWLVPQEPGR